MTMLISAQMTIISWLQNYVIRVFCAVSLTFSRAFLVSFVRCKFDLLDAFGLLEFRCLFISTWNNNNSGGGGGNKGINDKFGY